jgi:hypothetical protein
MPNGQAGTGGTGTSNSISGSSLTYSVGGNGATYLGATLGTAGSVNRGNGGGGSGGESNNGANGGSGIVILKYPSNLTIGGGSGLTFTTSTVGSSKITTFTLGTGNISFS